MRRSSVAAALAGGLLACGPGAPLVLPPPAFEGAQAMVVSVADRRSDPRAADPAGVVVHAVPAGEAVEVTRALGEVDVRLELLLYPSPLEALPLAPGPLAPAAGTSGRPLPDGARAYEAEIVDGEPSAWLPRTRPSASLAAFRTTAVGPTALPILAAGCRPDPGLRALRAADRAGRRDHPVRQRRRRVRAARARGARRAGGGSTGLRAGRRGR
jgi:hypothetical protein